MKAYGYILTMRNNKGILFAIKRYAIHDGPNIRTTVFLKGCHLKCWWCHNPEGISHDIKLLSDASQCIECQACVENCPPNALVNEQGKIQRDPHTCETCQGCVENCPALVHSATGWESSVEDVMAEILKDKPFFDESGGGVTFSGGEPLLQPQFLKALLEECNDLGVHTSLDTTAHAPQDTIESLFPLVDLWMVDLKHMDDGVHREQTSMGNKQILDNLKWLDQHEAHLRLRIPLIPGFNDSEHDMKELAKFASTLQNPHPVDILPYHKTALSKYAKLELDYPSAGAELKLSGVEAVEIMSQFGHQARIGG